MAGRTSPTAPAWHGSVVAANAILGLRRTVSDAGLPRVTLTRPEVATVGVSAAEAARRPGWRVLDLDHRHLNRAVTDDAGPGLTSMVVDRRDRIWGGLVVAPRAGETVGEIALAVAEKVTAKRLTGVTHPYPTFNDGPWNLAVGEYRRRLGVGASRLLLAALHRRRAHSCPARTPERRSVCPAGAQRAAAMSRRSPCGHKCTASDSQTAPGHKAGAADVGECRGPLAHLRSRHPLVTARLMLFPVLSASLISCSKGDPAGGRGFPALSDRRR